MISGRDLALYWSGEFLAANAFIGLNLVGALLLGMVVGYERSYNGRAAGMRTYGLVCMSSTALTVFVGYAPLWFGGAVPQASVDPTRVIQGVCLTFHQSAAPAVEELVEVALAHGYRVVRESFSITVSDSQPLWRFGVLALDRSRSTSPALLAQELARSADVARFSIVPVRN